MSKKVTIFDYGSGNLHSIAKAVEKVAGDDDQVRVSAKAEDIDWASHLILPGVGAFADCLSGLMKYEEAEAALENAVINQKKPFLGICVGMQMLAEKGFEHGEHSGLGWIKGKVVPIPAEDGLKIPHMGWNTLEFKQNHPIFDGISECDHVYFVHSYFFECEEVEDVIATVNYGKSALTATIAHDNIVATQFHPEKSQVVGLKLLGNFLKM